MNMKQDITSPLYGTYKAANSSLVFTKAEESSFIVCEFCPYPLIISRLQYWSLMPAYSQEDATSNLSSTFLLARIKIRFSCSIFK